MADQKSAKNRDFNRMLGRYLILTLKRKWWLVLLVGGLIVGLGTFYIYKKGVRYEASASFIVSSGDVSVQYQRLISRDLLRDAVRRLDEGLIEYFSELSLGGKYNMYNRSPFRLRPVTAPEYILNRVLEVNFTSEDAVEVRSVSGKPELEGSGKVGEVIRLGAFHIRIERTRFWRAELVGRKFYARVNSENSFISDIQGRLYVEQLRTRQKVLTLIYADQNRERALDIVAAIAASFRDHWHEINTTIIRNETAAIDREIKAVASEMRIDAFMASLMQRQNNAAMPRAEIRAQLVRLDSLNRALEVANLNLSQLRTLARENTISNARTMIRQDSLAIKTIESAIRTTEEKIGADEALRFARLRTHADVDDASLSAALKWERYLLLNRSKTAAWANILGKVVPFEMVASPHISGRRSRMRKVAKPILFGLLAMLLTFAVFLAGAFLSDRILVYEELLLAADYPVLGRVRKPFGTAEFRAAFAALALARGDAERKYALLTRKSGAAFRACAETLAESFSATGLTAKVLRPQPAAESAASHVQVVEVAEAELPAWLLSDVPGQLLGNAAGENGVALLQLPSLDLFPEALLQLKHVDALIYMVDVRYARKSDLQRLQRDLAGREDLPIYLLMLG